MMRSGLAAIALCFATTSAMAQTCAVTVKDDIQPIFDMNCVACHQDASPGEGLSLQGKSMLANTVNVASSEAPSLMRIVPGDPEASYLFRKISGTHVEAGGSGERMPLGGQLYDDEIEAIRTWIADCDAAG